MNSNMHQYNPNDFNDDEMVEVTEEELMAIMNQMPPIDDDGDTDSVSEDESEINDEQGPSSYTSVFTGHVEAVFACALCLDLGVAVTGGQDDRVFVWNPDTGAQIHELERHSDTVIFTAFNYNNTYLAAGDLSGHVKVYKVTVAAPGEVSFAMTYETDAGDSSHMCWHPKSNVLAICTDEGGIHIWHVPSLSHKILGSAGSKCAWVAWSYDGTGLLAGYENGTRLWDVKLGTMAWEVQSSHPLSHKTAVNVVACNAHLPLYVAADSTGMVVFYSGNGPVGSAQANGDVECLAFAPSLEFRMLAAGTLHGNVCIFDYTNFSLRAECENPIPGDGIIGIRWIDNYNIIVYTSTGYIHGYDARSGNLNYTKSVHLGDIYNLSLDLVHQKILTVSEDRTCKIQELP